MGLSLDALLGTLTACFRLNSTGDLPTAGVYGGVMTSLGPFEEDGKAAELGADEGPASPDTFLLCSRLRLRAPSIGEKTRSLGLDSSSPVFAALLLDLRSLMPCALISR